MNGASPCLEQKNQSPELELDTRESDLTNIVFYYKCSTSEKLK